MNFFIFCHYKMKKRKSAVMTFSFSPLIYEICDLAASRISKIHS
jgi:hypothetical protein